jgi:cell division protein FtsQ
MASLAAPAPALPFDVRLMNGVASALFVVAGVGLVAAGAVALARSPWFPIRAIQIEGELQRNSVATIRANTTPRLAGNLLAIDLERARAVFESVPWVRQATLRRVWPDTLAVRLEEHRPAALWIDPDGNERLVNDHGEVFEANLGDVEDDALPEFTGPPGTADAMLALYRRLAPVFDALGRPVRALQLSGRGSWRVTLDGGARVELGRGSDDEVVARSERFVRTVGQVTERWQRDLESADLRHADGYAVRMRGITTTIAPAGAATKTTKR